MIKCPHCGETVIHEPEGLEKLSRQQSRIYRLFVENPTRIWTNDAIAARIYALDADGGPVDAKNVILVQIHRIRKRLGNIIETTHSGYRLRLPKNDDSNIKSTTESEK